jgi:hypothetical protein
MVIALKKVGALGKRFSNLDGYEAEESLFLTDKRRKNQYLLAISTDIKNY